MVKCICSERKFHNMGKLARHCLKHGNSDKHRPDMTHDRTKKSFKRYIK